MLAYCSYRWILARLHLETRTRKLTRPPINPHANFTVPQAMTLAHDVPLRPTPTATHHCPSHRVSRPRISWHRSPWDII